MTRRLLRKAFEFRLRIELLQFVERHVAHQHLTVRRRVSGQTRADVDLHRTENRRVALRLGDEYDVAAITNHDVARQAGVIAQASMIGRPRSVNSSELRYSKPSRSTATPRR